MTSLDQGPDKKKSQSSSDTKVKDPNDPWAQFDSGPILQSLDQLNKIRQGQLVNQQKELQNSILQKQAEQVAGKTETPPLNPEDLLKGSLATEAGIYNRAPFGSTPYGAGIADVRSQILKEVQAASTPEALGEKSLDNPQLGGLGLILGGALNLLSLPFGGKAGTDVFGGNIGRAKQERLIGKLAAVDEIYARGLNAHLDTLRTQQGIVESGLDIAKTILSATSKVSGDFDPNTFNTVRIAAVKNMAPWLAELATNNPNATETARLWRPATSGGDLTSSIDAGGFGGTLLDTYYKMAAAKTDSEKSQLFDTLVNQYRLAKDAPGNDNLLDKLKKTAPQLISMIISKLQPNFRFGSKESAVQTNSVMTALTAFQDEIGDSLKLLELVDKKAQSQESTELAAKKTRLSKFIEEGMKTGMIPRGFSTSDLRKTGVPSRSK